MTLILHQHPFASYCWKALIALYERDVPFEPKLVGDEADRAGWPGCGHGAASRCWWTTTPGWRCPSRPRSSSTWTVDDGRLIPRDPDAALQPRLWDRIFDGHVMTPMQKIVADSLRPEHARDPFGVDEARAALDTAYGLADARLGHVSGRPAPGSPWPTAPGRRRCSTRAWCIGGTRTRWPT